MMLATGKDVRSSLGMRLTGESACLACRKPGCGSQHGTKQERPSRDAFPVGDPGAAGPHSLQEILMQQAGPHSLQEILVQQAGPHSLQEILVQQEGLHSLLEDLKSRSSLTSSVRPGWDAGE